MGPELLIVSAALSAFQGFQQYQQGKDQAKAAKQAGEYNAQVIANQSAVDKRRMQREQSAFLASQRVKGAASGATISSFEDTFEASKEQSLLDISLLDYDNQLRQQNARYGASQQAYQAESEGRSGLISGLTNAAGSAVSYGDATNFGKKQVAGPFRVSPNTARYSY